jgi:hypothetical protein
VRLRVSLHLLHILLACRQPMPEPEAMGLMQSRSSCALHALVDSPCAMPYHHCSHTERPTGFQPAVSCGGRIERFEDWNRLCTVDWSTAMCAAWGPTRTMHGMLDGTKISLSLQVRHFVPRKHVQVSTTTRRAVQSGVTLPAQQSPIILQVSSGDAPMPKS